MKQFIRISLAALLAAIFVLVLSGPTTAFAATTPVMGMTSTFGILASTYTNTAAGTTIGRDLGYTTGPAVAPTVNGATHVADATYTQAGKDQATALAYLNGQAATFTFAPGAIDLASDVTHGAVGVYTPGVYVMTGAANIGGGGTITLNGAGTYIFKMDGALGTSANSIVNLTNGASPCDVFWIPTAATTLGANSTFAGTDIDASGITIGSTVAWNGRALAFGGTASTNVDVISVPNCGVIESAARARDAALAASRLPSTGASPWGNTTLWFVFVPMAIIVTSTFLIVSRKKKNI